jgi:hypothetical protein
VVSLLSQLLYSWEKSCPITTEQQNRSGHFREEKNLFPLLGFKPQTAQPAAQSL